MNDSIMNGSTISASAPPGSVWEITVRPGDWQDAAGRDRLLGQVRASLEKKLRDDPQARDLTWRTPLGTLEARAGAASARLRPGRARHESCPADGHPRS